MGEPLAACHQVIVWRGRRQVLGPVTLSIESGSLLGVVGPNGAGKTTLLRTLAGIQAPTSGTLMVAGTQQGPGSGRRPRELRRDVAFLLQHNEVHHDLPITVDDVVGFARIGRRRIGGRRDPADVAALAAAIELLGLEPLRRRLYRELSGGQRQKVQLARIVAQGARLVLLDEPAAGLDLDWRERLTALVERVHTSTGAAVVMVTHEIDRLPRSCEQVLLLREGRALAIGAPAAVLTAPALSCLYGCDMAVHAEDGRFYAHSRRPRTERDDAP